MRLARCSIVFAAALAAAGALPGLAAAQDPAPQYRAQDVIDAYTRNNAGQSKCPAGTLPADDGICDPATSTRGFSLATPSAPSRTGGGAMNRNPAGGPAVSAPAPRTRTARAAYRPSAPLASNVSPGDLLINFELGSSQLTAQARANARAFAEALKSPALSSSRFALGGHTDASGPAGVNTTLSQSRAEAVKSFLVSEGVSADRLEAEGFGSARLVDPAHPFAPTNRRVEGLRLN